MARRRRRHQTAAANISVTAVAGSGTAAFALPPRRCRPVDRSERAGIIISGVDLVVGIAIRSEAGARLTKCVAGDDVVGSIDAAVAVFVSRQGLASQQSLADHRHKAFKSPWVAQCSIRCQSPVIVCLP